jgi:hypothetical protein
VKFLRKRFVKKSSSLHIDRIGGQWPYTSCSKKSGYISKINMEKRKGKSQCIDLKNINMLELIINGITFIVSGIISSTLVHSPQVLHFRLLQKRGPYEESNFCHITNPRRSSRINLSKFLSDPIQI